ncbi:hypothetical protein QFC22_005543 [Naganishia vaughanmartiniae]|uniref:Uncharacterized protein n=1 Tax=Naganishia vaughanmartiniae TaxID=1424756 RepID=A0ACC2WSQ5_9TREE|nr:hypothetical protein QFC22_005543 [Naganishia vaughanmartiniae]
MSPAADPARIPFPSASSPTPSGSGSRQQSQAGLASNSATIPRRTTNLTRPSPLSRLHSSPVPHTQEVPRLETRPTSLFKAPPSPCYVHSHLEKYGHLPPGESYSPWSANAQNLATTNDQVNGEQRIAEEGQPQIKTQKVDSFGGKADQANSTTQGGLQKMKDPCETGEISPGLSAVSTFSSNDPDGPAARHRLQVSAPAWEDLDDAEDGGSITRQLAETATGVREMSKQLGRTKVKSNIQHVLIVTKARDNGLIKLTREVAVYLMSKKTGSNGRSNGSGMVVYVDAQLRTSKRFNAAGLERERPEFFKPLPRRRASSSASVHTLSTSMSDVSLLSRANSSSGAKRRSDVGRDAENEQGQLRYWTADMCSNTPNLFDFVVTLGGDGTVLFTSWLFQRIVPPVLPFALGSLGFLTNFDYSNFRKTIDNVVDDGIRVNLRMRFTCVVYRAIAPEEDKRKGPSRKAIKSTGGDILISRVGRDGWESVESSNAGAPPCRQKKDKEIMCYSTRPVETFEVLNDLVVDRGPSPYVSLLELFGDDHHLTTVQADGLCIATPTGSTAYSLSAGGSLVHPGIPAILISPICPHTLSFRPMLLPDSMEVRVCVPYNSRSTAWASFDGRGRIELKPDLDLVSSDAEGDYIKITASKYPFPTVCAEERSVDWFHSISRTLRWNEREKQKSFVVVEEDRPKEAKDKVSKNIEHHGSTKESARDDKARIKLSKHQAQDGQDALAEKTHEESIRQANLPGERPEPQETSSEEEEEEEGFDIDDISTPTQESTSPKESKDEPLARPKYSSKRPSQLLGLDGMKSGVDTPDRFIFPHKQTVSTALSPNAFATALDKGLTRLSKLDSQAIRQDGSTRPLDKGQPEPLHDHEVGQRDHIGEPGSLLHTAGHSIPSGRAALLPGRLRGDVDAMDLKTPKNGRAAGAKPAEHSPPATARYGHDRAPGESSRRRIKVLAFYGQDESDSSGDEDTYTSDHHDGGGC